MADPKYANLPGIDLNSPDVYETNDLPEDDQALQKDTDDQGDGSRPADVVERINVTPNEAFDKFKTKDIDSSSTDFSDRITKSRRVGYRSAQNEYALGGDRSTETLMEKYQRLQQEIQELGEELSKAQESVKSDDDNTAALPVTKQVEHLNSQLADLQLDQLLGDKPKFTLSDPQGALQQRLISELSTISSSHTSAKKEPGESVDGNSVLYELYYNPEQSRESKAGRVATIEQKLEMLESQLGTRNSDAISLLTTETNNKSIVGAVEVLTSKLKLLDPTQLEQIEGRLHALSYKLNQVTEKKDAIENAEKKQQVADLYQLVKKWDTMAVTLPQVVERLTSLKDLHEQALQFSQALSSLDAAQQQVSTLITTHSDMLKSTQVAMKENSDMVKANAESIDARIKALSK